MSNRSQKQDAARQGSAPGAAAPGAGRSLVEREVVALDDEDVEPTIGQGVIGRKLQRSAEDLEAVDLLEGGDDVLAVGVAGVLDRLGGHPHRIVRLRRVGAWVGVEGLLLWDRGLRTFSRSSFADLDSSTAYAEETERALGRLKSDNSTLITFGGGDAV